MGKSSFLQDFKAFAMRGNVIDMAVGVIIGGAFGKIVSSIVADVIMPPIGLLVGGVNFTDLKLQLKPAEVVDGVEKAAVTLNYGNFLQATFDFIIIAFSKNGLPSNACRTARDLYTSRHFLNIPIFFLHIFPQGSRKNKVFPIQL